jgi:putative endonuclease
MNHAAGGLAEATVIDRYIKNGFDIAETRWRKSGGEIDIIARHKATVYFIEVKCAETFDRAAERITPAQQSRIHAAAQEYFALNDLPLETPCRFDAALVTHDGKVKVIPNAF